MTRVKGSPLTWLVVLVTLLALGGCDREGSGPGDESLAPRAPAPQAPAPQAPAPQAPAPQAPAPQAPAPQAPAPGDGSNLVIRPGEGGLPGGMQILNGDGRDVWPPQGPGCDRYVACCAAAAAVASELSLACQIYVAAPPVDCAVALQGIRSTIGERGLTMPPACAP